MPPKYTYFSPEKDNIGGLDDEFLSKLDIARAKTIQLDPDKRGVPFIIASGFRTPEKNQSVIGAVPDSSHLTGHAVDLAVENDHEVWFILFACQMAGLNRFGIYVNANNVPTHIHVDDDPGKVPEVVWIKREGQINSPVATA